MFVWSFFWFLLIISSLNMATRGKATKFTVEKPVLMLDSSFSGSELKGFESDDSLEGYWQNENEQEAGCTDGGASHDSRVAEGETSISANCGHTIREYVTVPQTELAWTCGMRPQHQEGHMKLGLVSSSI